MLALAGELDTLRKTLDPASSHGIVTTVMGPAPKPDDSSVVMDSLRNEVTNLAMAGYEPEITIAPANLQYQ